MKKFNPLILAYLLACPMIFSQQSRPVPAGGATGPAAASAAGDARQSLEDRRIRRVLVIARAGTYDPKTLRRVEEQALQLAEAVNSQANLEKSDAPRTAVPLTGLQRMAAQMRELNDARRGALNIIRMTPGSGGGDSPRCSAESCPSSVCFTHQNICVCTLCWPRGGSGAGARSASAGSVSGTGTGLLVVAAPEDVRDTELESLIQLGLAELQAMPESPQLVIKTRSLAP